MWVAHYAVGVSSVDASPTAEPARIGTTGRRILLANVVAEVGIVITGGLVRLTGSGLGCPTWPECTEGSLVPVSGQSEGLHKFIEFGNRLLTFAVLAAAVASLIVVLRPFLASHWARHWAGRSDRWGEPGATRPTLVWLAIAVLAGIFGQALLGGVTVLLDLHPATVAAHFLLSMLMIAASFVLYRRALESADEPRIRTVRFELVWVARAIVVPGVYRPRPRHDRHRHRPPFGRRRRGRAFWARCAHDELAPCGRSACLLGARPGLHVRMLTEQRTASTLEEPVFGSLPHASRRGRSATCSTSQTYRLLWWPRTCLVPAWFGWRLLMWRSQRGRVGTTKEAASRSRRKQTAASSR